MAEPTKAEVQAYAVAAAQHFGVPEELFIKQLTQENSWHTDGSGDHAAYDRKGNYIGMVRGVAQILDSTAQSWGINSSDWKESIAAAAQHMSEYATKYNDNKPADASNTDAWNKALVAYNAGPGAVDNAIKESEKSGFTIKPTLTVPGTGVQLPIDKVPGLGGVPSYNTGIGGKSWESFIPDASKDYISKINGGPAAIGNNSQGQKGVISDAKSFASSYGGGSGSNPGSGHPTSSQGTITNSADIKIPDYNDDKYWSKDKSGAWVHATSTWQADVDFAIKQKQALDKTKLDALGPYSQYIDDSITEMQQQIAAGNLSVTKANDLVTARINAYKTAADTYNSKAFSSGAPVGAKYIPGTEPGNPNGYTPIPITGGVVTNPLQDAADAVSYSDKTLGAVNIPAVPDYRGQRQALFAGALGIDTSKPPSAPPPPPTPVPSNVNLESHLSGTTNTTDPNSLFKQALAQAQTNQFSDSWNGAQQ